MCSSSNNLQINNCSSTIGVDDFSFKKRHNYGTIIVNKKTYKLVAILNVRDEKTLYEWLKNNKHIKMVTRDCATAYAKIIVMDLLKEQILN